MTVFGAAVAERAALMRAEVRERVVAAADVEDTELAAADPDDSVRAGRELLGASDRVLDGLSGHVR